MPETDLRIRDRNFIQQWPVGSERPIFSYCCWWENPVSAQRHASPLFHQRKLSLLAATYIKSNKWSYHPLLISLSCHRHGYPRPFLATSPYCSSLPTGPQGYTPYPAVCKFELVILLLLGHVKGSIVVHHLWARPYFSSSVLHVWFV